MKFPKLSNETLISRSSPQDKKIRIVLDTDTYNEVDDQFVLAYALKPPERIQVEAVYTAPFYNNRSSSPGDGMGNATRRF